MSKRWEIIGVLHTHKNVDVPVLSNITSFGMKTTVFTNVFISVPSTSPLCILGDTPNTVQ